MPPFSRFVPPASLPPHQQNRRLLESSRECALLYLKFYPGKPNLHSPASDFFLVPPNPPGLDQFGHIPPDLLPHPRVFGQIVQIGASDRRKEGHHPRQDRKSTRLNSSHSQI